MRSAHADPASVSGPFTALARWPRLRPIPSQRTIPQVTGITTLTARFTDRAGSGMIPKTRTKPTAIAQSRSSSADRTTAQQGDGVSTPLSYYVILTLVAVARTPIADASMARSYRFVTLAAGKASLAQADDALWTSP